MLLTYELSEQMKKNKNQKTNSKKDTKRKEDEINLWDLLLEASKLGIFPKMH